jgi:C4-dicarboxylate transporter, DctM subunit
MSPFIISLIGLVIFLILMSQGMPIAFSFALVGMVGIIFVRSLGTGLSQAGDMPFTWATNGTLLAIPLFVLMGQFAFESGISSELFSTAYKWAGRLPGGLAVATTLACTGFAACCGVSVAAAATMGSVAYPEMKKFRYSPRLASGCIAAGASLSCLIPPSAAFIVYGVFTQTSIGKLFIAGIIPGVLLAILYIAIILVMCKQDPELGPQGPIFTFKEKIAATRGVLGMLILFLIVIGGMFAGIFTPSEAGAMGALGAFIIYLIKRRFKFSGIKSALRDSMITTSFILTITIGAMIFNNFLALGGFTETFKTWLGALSVSKHLIMFCILIIYIPLGMFMDGLAMLLLTLPIVFPVVSSLGFDPIWFGIVITLLVETALITPPVGLNSFVVHGITKVPLGDVFRGILPFFGMQLIWIAMLYIFPQITLFLPGIMKQ